jgi:hypothetical protein
VLLCRRNLANNGAANGDLPESGQRVRGNPVRSLIIAWATAVRCLVAGSARAAALSSPETDLPRALEVTRSMETHFLDPVSHLYNDKADTKNKPAAAWAVGVAFSADLGAARQQPAIYKPILWNFFLSMDRYWDRKQQLGGYEPVPTNGNGHDKYFDDNEWIAITLVEGFETTGRREMLNGASADVNFIQSGWDDALGGGFWWHEQHKGNGKNTCANGPAAVAFLRLARNLPPTQAIPLVRFAQKTVDWTVKNLQNDDGRFADNITTDGQVNRGALTYNTALMIRAELLLYRATGNAAHLEAAERMEKAAEAFVHRDTGRYGDKIRWSHLLVEADLAMYRQDRNPHWLERARAAVDAEYAAWKSAPSEELLDIASLARELWLLNESHTTAGIAFWTKADGPIAKGTSLR